MNYDRIYEYRFKDVAQEKREEIWQVLSPFIDKKLGHPDTLLDPAAGRGEFIRFSSARERWAVEPSDQIASQGIKGIKVLQEDIFSASLPKNYFQGIFVSNFLEHLPSPEKIAVFLEKMYDCLMPGKVIVVMSPNFKLLLKDYFDCSDHILPLTEISVSEQIYAAGFDILERHKAFLPYSFRSRLPVSPLLTKMYLTHPVLWAIFGKQYLIIARKQ